MIEVPPLAPELERRFAKIKTPELQKLRAFLQKNEDVRNTVSEVSTRLDALRARYEQVCAQKQVVSFASRPVRFIELVGTNNSLENGYFSIRELEAYCTPEDQ